MSKTNTTRTARTAWAILGALTWAVGLRHDVKRYSLTVDECEAGGVPEGSTEPCAWAVPLGGSPWWTLDLWSDGDCIHARVLGWALEVHYEARGGATVSA
jgi:hypothetical protein